MTPLPPLLGPKVATNMTVCVLLATHLPNSTTGLCMSNSAYVSHPNHRISTHSGWCAQCWYAPALRRTLSWTLSSTLNNVDGPSKTMHIFQPVPRVSPLLFTRSNVPIKPLKSPGRPLEIRGRCVGIQRIHPDYIFTEMTPPYVDF
jgi:hypothetical protein